MFELFLANLYFPSLLSVPQLMDFPVVLPVRSLFSVSGALHASSFFSSVLSYLTFFLSSRHICNGNTSHFSINDFHFAVTLRAAMVRDFWIFPAAVTTLWVRTNIDFSVTSIFFSQWRTALWTFFGSNREILILFVAVFYFTDKFLCI